jgi:hypothetical protein
MGVVRGRGEKKKAVLGVGRWVKDFYGFLCSGLFCLMHMRQFDEKCKG